MPVFSVTTPAEVRRALLARREIALLDVRPESRFAQGHPLFAASFPLAQLEALATERLPRADVPVVLYGNGAYDIGGAYDTGGGDPDAAAAAARLARLGYREVSLLAGGLDGWTADGGELFTDVNAPSKAFGELVAEQAGTPLLPAEEVAALLGALGDVVVVDARRFDEYAVMSIPTATSVPGAELVLRAGQLAPDPAAIVIVNCAGRTRSIIGAQSLINAGLPNRVAALRNGTLGWTLAGLELEHGQARRAPEVAADAAGRAATAAWLVADRVGVRRASAAELDGLLATLAEDGTRTVYQFDVRSPEEYAAGHRPGFRSASGGQLVQETDWYAPVRGALLVLDDDGGGRAAMTGSWLAQMGWEVVIAEHDGRPLARAPWPPSRPAAPAVPLTEPRELAAWLRDGEAAVIDLETSKRFTTGHVEGSSWAPRAALSAIVLADTGLADTGLADTGLAGRLGQPRRLVLTSADGYLAAWAAADLGASRYVAGPALFALAGGTGAWQRAGLPMAAGPERLLAPADDVYRRPYEGTGVDPAVMQAYLDWEYGLTAQLDRDGTHGFRVLLPR